ncbi:MAG: transglycosylase domain-containing protein [Anaerolineales bacterium]|nr:transglycosylase domain-containing protein [Anaerolineales bacterium]
MVNFSQVPRVIHRKRKSQYKRVLPASRLRITGFIFSVLISITLSVGAITAGVKYIEISQNLPSIDQLQILLDGPEGIVHQPTQFYDRTGATLLYEIRNPDLEGFIYLPLSEINDDFISAVLATQEPGFWQHKGREQENGIAQQLVRDFLLISEPEGKDKDIRARILAEQVLSSYGHEKVLEWYLNSVNFGSQAYGVGNAAQIYFGRSPGNLSLAESAMLASFISAPEINPLSAPSLVVKNQSQVLQKMLGYGFISIDEAVNANAEPINIISSGSSSPEIAPTFINLAIQQVSELIPEERLLGGGYKIITTLDIDYQKQISCATLTQLNRLISSGGDSVTISDCYAARLLPSMGQTQTLPEGRSISANSIVMDADTSQILALYSSEETNATIGTDLYHEPGTILAPFVYLSAFSRGFTPATTLWDIPSNIPDELIPVMVGNISYKGPMMVREALVNNFLSPLFQTIQQVGLENTTKILSQSGIYSARTDTGFDVRTYLLGEANVSFVDVVHGFGTIANHGLLTGQEHQSPIGSPDAELQASAVLSVSDHSGREIINWSQPQIQSIVNEQLSFLITDILSDPTARDTSLDYRNAMEINRPIAAIGGKSLTTEDTWVVGYSPDLVVGVWMGSPEYIKDFSLDGNDLSIQPAAGLWHAIAQYTHQNLQVSNWEMPVGVTEITVCNPSGDLPTENCPQTVKEVFINGTQPTQLDTLYKSYQINRETGNLATIFTPATLIEERVFLDYPAEAKEWAETEGLEISPDAYDVIFYAGSNSEDLSISTPEIFSYASGDVLIKGTITSDISSYRLFVGAGLNPQQWLKIDEGETPEGGEFEFTWNTEDLNGLYAVRLQGIYPDQTIDSIISQITLDNTLPEVSITYPSNSDTINLSFNSIVPMQASARDNLGVAQVTFRLDGETLGTVTNTPFVFPWNAQPGVHTLIVEATDLAGNQIQAEISFEVSP